MNESIRETRNFHIALSKFIRDRSVESWCQEGGKYGSGGSHGKANTKAEGHQKMKTYQWIYISSKVENTEKADMTEIKKLISMKTYHRSSFDNIHSIRKIRCIHLILNKCVLKKSILNPFQSRLESMDKTDLVENEYIIENYVYHN